MNLMNALSYQYLRSASVQLNRELGAEQKRVHFTIGKVPTSEVQDPEFEGWKKLSVEAMSLTRLSRALDPARWVLTFEPKRALLRGTVK